MAATVSSLGIETGKGRPRCNSTCFRKSRIASVAEMPISEKMRSAAEAERLRQEQLRAQREQEAMERARRELADQGDGKDAIEVSAFSLYQNPYQCKGKLLWLDPSAWPLLRNGAALGLQNLSRNLAGFAGLRFHRMLDERDALYDVSWTGCRCQPAFDLRKVGELVVQVEGATEGNLRMDRIWHLDGLGVFTGINAFGNPTAPLQIPAPRSARRSRTQLARQVAALPESSRSPPG